MSESRGSDEQGGAETPAIGSGAVLIVEPSGFVAGGVRKSIGHLGVKSTECDSVPSALQILLSDFPSAVIASHELNGLPADSLFAALRASPRHRSIPVAMMTGSADRDFEVNYPVFRKDPSLGSEIVGWLRSLGLGVKAGPEKTLDGVRMLMAEDTASMRRLLAHKFHLRGAQVTLAEDGFEAGVLGLRDRYDLIVLDIEMPRLDGRDACRIFRDSGVECPVIALTAHDDPVTVSSLINEHGFHAVIAKSDAIGSLERYWSDYERMRSVA